MKAVCLLVNGSSPKSDGFSLIELLVVLSILGIMSMALATLLSNQSKQQTIVMQKSEIIDLKQTIQNSMSNLLNCACLMNPTNNKSNEYPLSFDSTALPASIQLKYLYSACDATTKKPTFPLAQENTFLPGTQTHLKISKILLSNIQKTGGINEFQGDFEVQFDASSTAGVRRPLTVTQRFIAEGPANAMTVKSCNISGSTMIATGGCIRYEHWTNKWGGGKQLVAFRNCWGNIKLTGYGTSSAIACTDSNIPKVIQNYDDFIGGGEKGDQGEDLYWGCYNKPSDFGSVDSHFEHICATQTIECLPP